MSRTHRLRHLPKLGGNAKKFVDGSSSYQYVKEENLIWHEVAHELLQMPCKHPDRAVNSVNHELCLPRKYFSRTEIKHLFERVERGYFYSVRSMGWHPWVSRIVYRDKKKWRTRGNKSARRIARQQIRKGMAKDDYEGINAENWHFIDRWELT